MPYKDATKQREYQRNWLNKRREEAVAYLGGKCVDCGTTEDLEFDHIHPELKAYPTRYMLSLNLEDRTRELDKCQLLCNNCHKKKTNEQRIRQNTLHGTTTKYRDGCRCQDCRYAVQAYRTTKVRIGDTYY